MRFAFAWQKLQSSRIGAILGLLAFDLLVIASIAHSQEQIKEADRYLRFDEKGELTYQPNERGDRIPDFSHAGYGGGGVALPDAPVKVVVPSSKGDSTERIQRAIDYVSKLPLNEQGMRGAVLLAKGRHEVNGSLRISAGGVVLRGEGSDSSATVVVATGTDRRSLIRLSGKNDRHVAADQSKLAAEYVPVGSTTVKVDDAGKFQKGDSICIVRPSTVEWIKSLGMDCIGAPKAGFHWLPGKTDLCWERNVKAVDGNSLTLDAPLTTALDPKFGGGCILQYTWPGRISQVGVENLRFESEYDHSNPHDEQHSWDAITMECVQDAWARDVAVKHFAGSAVNILETCSAVTVEDCKSTEPISEIGGYRRHTFYTAGQRTLFLRCQADGGRHDFAVGYLAGGPNAFVECTASNAHNFSGPIESWASGVLYDNVTMDGGGLSLSNREIEVKGIGWAAANCVLFQCTAPIITCRAPPGANNWAIGCWGQFIGDGGWKSLNEFVNPDSLYQEQLRERLGDKAVANLKRTEISIDAAGAKSVDDLPKESIAAKPGSKPLKLENGWLTCGGQLLIGNRIGTVWWSGENLPTAAGARDAGITRFIPGREGPRFTDDLDKLTDSMLANHQVAIEHNYALWYDRRRDDHEMIRRIDGDVWPPFYEQPWARSGQGAAWDGLSKYDLTKFNPWFFQRLGEFASQCDQKGLVLLHDGYFQHNILEAGAHWVDFPWRSANCLQATEFPEPPPFAGGKRIFMADLFYDIDHPVRRQMNELYIRHYLDELSKHTNVIYLNGEEFSGPLKFIQFWIDTIDAWEHSTGKKVLVGLSAPKDVQDAILTDERRSKIVNVIDMKYWWYTAAGEAYAPAGGQNLSPRQHYREWRGNKRFSPEQTVRQIREYRERYPDKAILFAPYQMSGWDHWAVLIGGGSMANVPPIDPELLAAIPKMLPLDKPAGLTEHQWALAEPGKSYLIYSSAGHTIRLDLPGESQQYVGRWIDQRHGTPTPTNETFNGGKTFEISTPGAGPAVLWLTRK